MDDEDLIGHVFKIKRYCHGNREITNAKDWNYKIFHGMTCLVVGGRKYNSNYGMNEYPVLCLQNRKMYYVYGFQLDTRLA